MNLSKLFKKHSGDYFTITGKYNTALVFTNDVDQVTIGQIQDLCNQKAFEGSNIVIMPDTHAGKGCVIGATMTLTDKIVPNLVGVDIGCGMVVYIFIKGSLELDFDRLENVIRENVPTGFKANSKVQPMMDEVDITKLEMYPDIYKPQRILNSLGSLGGGNHFIEVNEDEEHIYLVVHTGSRNLGKQVCEYYQNIAISMIEDSKERGIAGWVEKMKNDGKAHLIQQEMAKMKREKINPALAYLTGDAYWDYLHDMDIAQNYAHWNREQISANIIENMGWTTPVDSFQTIHNYIDMENMILRKGAISAQVGERVIIPLNMRDGSIIAYGEGNPDWNFSAPHGAGRLMSRGQAKRELDLSAFEETMSDVWSKSVAQSTLDEAPFAYKDADTLVDNVQDALCDVSIVKPLYNLKNC